MLSQLRSGTLTGLPLLKKIEKINTIIQKMLYNIKSGGDEKCAGNGESARKDQESEKTEKHTDYAFDWDSR